MLQQRAIQPLHSWEVMNVLEVNLDTCHLLSAGSKQQGVIVQSTVAYEKDGHHLPSMQQPSLKAAYSSDVPVLQDR